MTVQELPSQRRSTRIWTIVTLATLMVAGSFAAARAESPCGVSAFTPVKGKNGTTVVADSYMNCTGTGRWARELCTTLQEEFGFWINRGTGCSPNSPGDPTLGNAWNVSCAGHGTDNWRNRTDATDSSYETKVRFSPATSITC